MILNKALSFWGLPPDTKITLLAERENRVFKVECPSQPLSVLRVHRAGYHSDDALQSELQWMQYLAEQGMPVPVPVPTIAGELWVEIDGHQVDRMSWLDGRALGQAGKPLVLDDRLLTFRNLGESMARLHELSDAWELPAGFAREHWDLDGLLGEQPLWGRFWENPRLSDQQRSILKLARSQLMVLLSEQTVGLDYGLIHADMVRENVLLTGNQPHLLDFDDAGFGFRLFELATTLFKTRAEPDYVALEQALIEGYVSVRRLDVRLLPEFILLRALTYVGWIVPRMAECGGEARCVEAIERAVALAEEFLDLRSST